MAGKRKPAIQTRQGHPQGIVDDIAVGVIRAGRKILRKNPKITKGQVGAAKRKHAYSVWDKNTPKSVPRTDLAKQAAKVKATRHETRSVKQGVAKNNAITAYMDKKEAALLKKNGRLTGADLQRLAKIEANLRNTKIRKK